MMSSKYRIIAEVFSRTNLGHYLTRTVSDQICISLVGGGLQCPEKGQSVTNLVI